MCFFETIGAIATAASGVSASTVAAGAAVAGAAAGIYSGVQQSKQAKSAAKAAEDQAYQMEQELRRKNRNRPDMATLLAGNQYSGFGKNLTGVGGSPILPSTLGRPSLLGG